MLKTTTKMKKKISDGDLDSLKFFIYDNDEIEKDNILSKVCTTK